MKRTRQQFSRTRWVAALSVGVALLVCLTNFTGNGSGVARAGVAVWHYDIDNISRFPIAGSQYESLNGTGFPTSPVPIELLSLELHSPPHTLQTVPLPPPGSSAVVDSFFDVFVELDFFAPGSLPFDGFFDITYRVAGGGGGGGGVPEGTWPIELLAMNLTGNHPTLGPIMIRESPTLASLGEHSLHVKPPMAGMVGMLQIDSFFDVFTELSLDGGQMWIPADSAVRMSIARIVPEPATVALARISHSAGRLGWGVAKPTGAIYGDWVT